MLESTRIPSETLPSDKSTIFSTSNGVNVTERMHYTKDGLGNKLLDTSTETSFADLIKSPLQKSQMAFSKPTSLTSSEDRSSFMCEISSTVYAPDPVSEGLLDKIYQSHIYNEVSAVQPFGAKVERASVVPSTDTTEKVIGYTSHVGKERILSEEFVTRQIKVPKRIVYKDNYEKVVTVNESVLREEIVDTLKTVQEKVVKFTRPTVREKLVEVNTVQYEEEPVEIVQKVLQERIKHVPKIEYRVRDVEVPKYITNETIVEVPDIEIREVQVEKIVEVPEIKEKYIIKPVPVPEYVETPIPREIVSEKIVEVERNIPQPLEVISTVEYHLPQMKPKTQVIKYPLYVPRFIEVPVAAELFNEEEINVMNEQLSKLKNLTQSRAIGLRELEELTENCRNTISMASARMTPENYEMALSEAWKNGKLDIQGATVFPFGCVAQQTEIRVESPIKAQGA